MQRVFPPVDSNLFGIRITLTVAVEPITAIATIIASIPLHFPIVRESLLDYFLFLLFFFVCAAASGSALKFCDNLSQIRFLFVSLLCLLLLLFKSYYENFYKIMRNSLNSIENVIDTQT